MRVAHVATRHILGGAARNLNFMIETELEQGVEVHLVAGEVGSDAPVPDGVVVHTMPHLVREVSPRDDTLAVAGLRRLYRLLKVDAVHTHQSKAGIVGRIAAVGSVRAIMHTVHMSAFGRAYGARSAGFWLAERMCSQLAWRVVFVGHEVARIYIRSRVVPPDKAIVIHSPIDVDQCLSYRALASAVKNACRQRLGVPSGARLAVTAGALEARKRHDLALSRLSPLLQRGETYLAIAGRGPLASQLSALAKSLGVADRVMLLGHVDNFYELLAAADVLVHASEVEGVPQVVVQAQAVGLPVVATSVEGLSEIADADVRIVDRDGTGLVKAVAEAFASGPQPVPPMAFEPWRPQVVREQQRQMLNELTAVCRG
jgi:glycosyltransferase involved in cell wall biosynthesis